MVKLPTPYTTIYKRNNNQNKVPYKNKIKLPKVILSRTCVEVKQKVLEL